MRRHQPHRRDAASWTGPLKVPKASESERPEPSEVFDVSRSLDGLLVKLDSDLNSANRPAGFILAVKLLKDAVLTSHDAMRLLESGEQAKALQSMSRVNLVADAIAEQWNTGQHEGYETRDGRTVDVSGDCKSALQDAVDWIKTWIGPALVGDFALARHDLGVLRNHSTVFANAYDLEDHHS